MRSLIDHIVENDATNHQLEINVTDEPGAGGANHRYEITKFDASDNASAVSSAVPVAQMDGLVVLFQNGPIPEHGVNGVTQEALLAVVIDRLRSFQAGSFSCRENAIALTHCEDALMWLQRRTRARIRRGVEGSHQK